MIANFFITALHYELLALDHCTGNFTLDHGTTVHFGRFNTTTVIATYFRRGTVIELIRDNYFNLISGLRVPMALRELPRVCHFHSFYFYRN
jgi:hypothetical protein